MNVTLTHPISNFTGNVNFQDGAVVLGFTAGTCAVDLDPKFFNAVASYGILITIGTPGPPAAYDANYDVVTAAIVGAAGSLTTAALKAGYGLPVATTVTASGALVAQKHNPVDATSAAQTMTLPTGAAAGSRLAVEKIDASANAVTVTGSIRGVGSSSIALVWAHETISFAADASGSWWPVAGHKTKVTLDAAYAAYAKTAQLRWNARRQANYERDNALPFTVFVDSVKGSDANTGASPAQAWATLGKLTTATIAYGARIGLARGSTFTGNYTVPAPTGTGSATNRVVFGAYGVGNTPKISAGSFTIQNSYIDVQDMRFTGASGGYALFIFNATTATDNRVKRCEIDNNTQSGGLIMGCIGGLVEDCYVHDNWTGAEYPSGSGAGMFFTTGTDSTEVRYNVVRMNYKGIMAGNVHRDLNIHHNIVDKSRVNGIDMSGGGVVGHPAKIVNNFVWHRPTTPNGHGIDTQASNTGHFGRNNIVYCDFTGASGNVELYCVDSTAYTDGDYDYQLGFIAPTATNVNYGKLGASLYTTLAAFQTAMAATSYGGKEVHSISADPLIADLTNALFMPLPGSPAIDAGVAVGGVTDLAGFLGVAPDLGAYEVG